jgi:arginine/lysine/ornithine decarboxylase
VWISSVRIEKTTIRQSNVQAVAEHWASDAGWSVVGVTATGNRVLVQATGPNPAPDLAVLRRDLNDAGLNGLDVRVSLVPASYQPLPG